MARRVTDNTGDSLGWPVSKDPVRECVRRGRVQSDTGMIVFKTEDTGVRRIHRAADACVAGTKITIFNIFWSRGVLRLDGLTVPGTVLPVSGYNHPLLAQRMPSLFPNHMLEITAGGRFSGPSEGQALEVLLPRPRFAFAW